MASVRDEGNPFAPTGKSLRFIRRRVKACYQKYLSFVFQKNMIVCMRPAFTRGALRGRHER
jgi:hypothetical protein